MPRNHDTAPDMDPLRLALAVLLHLAGVVICLPLILVSPQLAAGARRRQMDLRLALQRAQDDGRSRPAPIGR